MTTTRAAPTTSGGPRRRTTSRASGTEHADIPATISTGWYDGFPHADTRVLRGDGGEEHARRSGWSSGRGATSACAATRPSRSTSTSARRASGACSATSRSSSRSSTAGCRTTRPASRADEAPVRIFVMGGGSGRKTAERQARPRRPLARRAGVAARARACRRRLPPPRRRLALDRARRRPAPSRGTSPTTRSIRCRRSAASTARSASFRPEGEGMEPMWARLLNPALRLRNIMTPGPADQKESPAFFAARSRTRGSPSGPTCSSTRPSRSRSRSR